VLTKLNLIHFNHVCPLPRGASSAAVLRQNEKMCLGWGQMEATPLPIGISWKKAVSPLRGISQPGGGGQEFIMDSFSVNL